jgi:predicted protein tyrosine phosphatase
MKVLFVCNQNQNRSKTAEEIFRSKFETKSVGLYNENPINSQDLNWADLVVVMEDSQRTEISKRFPKQYLSKKIISLDIPDIYKYNQESLIKILNEKFPQSIY